MQPGKNAAGSSRRIFPARRPNITHMRENSVEFFLAASDLIMERLGEVFPILIQFNPAPQPEKLHAAMEKNWTWTRSIRPTMHFVQGLLESLKVCPK